MTIESQDTHSKEDNQQTVAPLETTQQEEANFIQKLFHQEEYDQSPH